MTSQIISVETAMMSPRVALSWAPLPGCRPGHQVKALLHPERQNRLEERHAAHSESRLNNTQNTPKPDEFLPSSLPGVNNPFLNFQSAP